MLTDLDYNESIRLGIWAAQIAREGGQLSIVPLSLLYSAMVERKEIVTLKELPVSKKLSYWTKACFEEPGASKFRKILLCQSYYVIDILKGIE